MKDESTYARWIALHGKLHAAMSEAYQAYCLRNSCGCSDYSADWTDENQRGWNAEMDRITAEWAPEFEAVRQLRAAQQTATSEEEGE
ncbi:hypothetical protein [Antrihabitans stalactiti]|uniref:Uncharacterized protein n=1 Tax=Antrihabitans stalactiti TaxID=2584121 RepID=A0A848KK57_9NOCA|nr:hypothetical protein [Antrihabitans stalactiti]NMN99483.1 hypothetical protein [Antrihabitans stalactiti]